MRSARGAGLADWQQHHDLVAVALRDSSLPRALVPRAIARDKSRSGYKIYNYYKSLTRGYNPPRVKYHRDKSRAIARATTAR